MLDLFTIFSKGGIVLWCFQGSDLSLTSSVNNLIKSVILQERGGLGSFTHEALTIKYKLDNEFELVFVVAYQKFLQLSYVDKFLNDMQIEFRNRYKDDLSQGKLCRNLDSFNEFFKDKLKEVEETRKNEAKAPKMMRKFEESDKSKKTVASMIEHRKDDDVKKNVKKKNKPEKVTEKVLPVTNGKPKGSPKNPVVPESVDSSDQTDALILENRQKLFERNKKQPIKSPELIKTPDASKKSSKQKRQWELSGTSKDAAPLDYSDTTGDAETYTNGTILPADQQIYDSMKGELKDIESESSDSDEETTNGNKTSTKTNNKKGTFSLFSGLRNLVGSKVLTRENIQSALEKMKDHLIAKNVAADISARLCESVATRLEGKVLGTFKTVTSTVKQALEEACVQILIPRRRIDILRDAMEAKQKRNPYVITFCGVNGVGKSTNLAKICFWLIENDFRVLIAACDTFRAGAVEQLRTHCRKLDAIHNADRHNGQRMVQLYEKGYGKDDAGIAMEAINHARDQHFDVVLIDTAGRMQGNEPLMRSLAKLIKVNQPDLVLFVGEALVGNDAVDQLVKFNQALADFSSMENPHLIDGIVLTKFDTIDDKVGAAISMTYITGQPIVFVGTGQTYTDLKNLNARSVVHALLKS